MLVSKASLGRMDELFELRNEVIECLTTTAERMPPRTPARTISDSYKYIGHTNRLQRADRGWSGEFIIRVDHCNPSHLVPLQFGIHA